MIKNRNIKISVIIPCYNEEKNVKKGVLEDIYRYFKQQKYCWEVIIVNDESTDNSKMLIEAFIKNKPHFDLINIPHGGKPAGIFSGLQRAKGEIALFTDMDQSTPVTELKNLLHWYEKGFDIVIGSRGGAREGFTTLRKIGSFIFRIIRKLVILRNIDDTQCGFKSCRREIALQVFHHLYYFKQKKKPSGWKVSAYDVEFLYLVERAGHKIKEVVVKWRNCDQSDTKSQKNKAARYIVESIEMAREIILIKFRQIMGLYI